MEQMTNTLLPARMFVVCSTVTYGNEFQKAKTKISADCKEALMWGIRSCM